jgi:hypothetical protein
MTRREIRKRPSGDQGQALKPLATARVRKSGLTEAQRIAEFLGTAEEQEFHEKYNTAPAGVAKAVAPGPTQHGSAREAVWQKIQDGAAALQASRGYLIPIAKATSEFLLTEEGQRLCDAYNAANPAHDGSPVHAVLAPVYTPFSASRISAFGATNVSAPCTRLPKSAFAAPA